MDRRNGGCVKVAVNYYDITKINTFPEKYSLRAKELLLAKRQASRLKEIKRAANSRKLRAETGSRNSEKDLRSLVEEWNTGIKPKDRARWMGSNGEKSLAEAKIEMSNSKEGSYYGSVEEAFRKVIEEFCEEQIEALKGSEVREYSTAVAQTKKKIEDAKEEIERSKDLDVMLAVTLSDLVVLQDEFERIAGVGNATKNGEELESVMKELEVAKNELASVKGEGLELTWLMNMIRNELVHAAEERARRKKAEEEADATAQDLRSKLERGKSKLETVTAAEEKAKGVASELMLVLEQQKTEAEAAMKENELVNEKIAAIRMEIEKMDCEIDAAEESLKAAAAELESVRVSEAAAFRHLKTLIENASRERASVNQNRTRVTISKFEFDYLRERATGAKEVAGKKVEAAQAWVEALEASRREIVKRMVMARREVWDLRIEEEQHVYETEMSISAKSRAEDELRWSVLRSFSTKRRVEGRMKSRRSFFAKRWVEGELMNRRPKLETNSEADGMQLTPPIRSTRKPMREKGSSSLAERPCRSSASPTNQFLTLTRSTSFKLRKKKKATLNIFKTLKGEARPKSKGF